MGRDQLEPLVGGPVGIPVPESSEARFARWAREQEQAEHDVSEWEKLRGTFDRGTGGYRVQLEGQTVGRSAKSQEDLLQAIRRRLRYSHPTLTASETETFVNAAVRTYGERYPNVDRDWAWATELGLIEEQKRWSKDQILQGRALRREQIAGEIRRDTILQSKLEWEEKVNRLAAESGLDPAFVEEYLIAYDRANAPRFPGTIDPGLVPMFSTPVHRTAQWVYEQIAPILELLPGVGLLEAVIGQELTTGRPLKVWERVLGAVIDLLPLAGKAIGRGMRAVGRGIRAAARAGRAVAEAAAAFALATIRAAIPVERMLKFIGRMGKLSGPRLAALLKRLKGAAKAGERLELTAVDDAAFVRNLDEAFAEFAGHVPAGPAIKAATMRGFRFLSEAQQKTFGLLLGRRLTEGTSAFARAALQGADRAAATLRSRFADAWAGALGRGGETADRAAQRVFDDLVRARPPNPNEFVRTRLFDRWRTRAMNQVYADAALREGLEKEAGIVFSRSGGRTSMGVPIENLAGERVITGIDVDHALIPHREAVAEALRTSDYRQLLSTIDPQNLQLMLPRENRNQIEMLRKVSEHFNP